MKETEIEGALAFCEYRQGVRVTELCLFFSPTFLPWRLNPWLWSAILALWWGSIISAMILSRLILGRRARVTALKQAFDTKTVTNANSSGACENINL